MWLALTVILVAVALGQSLSLRGQDLHNNLVGRTADLLRATQCTVAIEHPIRLADGRTKYVDLFVQRGQWVWTCEVETTDRHLFTNIGKGLLTGLPLWIVVPDRRLRQAAQHQAALWRYGGKPGAIKILLVRQVHAELARCFPAFPAANPPVQNGKTNPTTPLESQP